MLGGSGTMAAIGGTGMQTLGGSGTMAAIGGTGMQTLGGSGTMAAIAAEGLMRGGSGAMATRGGSVTSVTRHGSSVVPGCPSNITKQSRQMCAGSMNGRCARQMW